MYKLYNKVLPNELDHVKRLSDNAFIPFDEHNIDYQEYLKWVAEGNTPIPADE
jgi:hypothetical protein